MRIKNRNGEGECYQVNSRVKAVYLDSTSNLASLTLDDNPVIDNQKYTLTLQGYHIANSKTNLNITNDELIAIESPKVIATSTYQVIEEWLRTHPNVTRKIKGRIIYKQSDRNQSKKRSQISSFFSCTRGNSPRPQSLQLVKKVGHIYLTPIQVPFILRYQKLLQAPHKKHLPELY